MKPLKHKHSLIMFIFILLISFISVILNINAQDEEVLFLEILRDDGAVIGDKIEGIFTINGSGPDFILNLTLLFNGVKVAFESDNHLIFQFYTKNYSLGLMNITLIGEDSEGLFYEKAIFKEFISPKVGSWIVILSGVITFIGAIVILKIISDRKEMKDKKQSFAEKKNKIKIVIDKKFRK
ncbi:hypothetical protein DSAG12_01074 [Promethearchaeum syntrophicum]|uniref:Uncharacterized protein n=1 Tax=Promethearchaeum syntrophicum TaxID=2594042 RepID=A0A5B9D7T0_9ARCH|nr:hypothetical protein [Candidatus Prometheoarchaeum syntrophicum]QEE15249.1 hypothetical protein DSAG12_01074 [Candidatus Prometheoarchaeum syntrophicum]